MHCRWNSLLVTVLFVAVANAGESKSRSAPVHKTPDECYAAMIKSGKEGDFAGTLNCLATADRQQMLGWLAYQVERHVFFQTEQKDAALALLKKNGLGDTDIMGLMQIYDSPGGKGVAKAVELVGSRIKEPVLFAKDATELLKQKPDANDPKPKEQPTPTLREVVIDGDCASARLSGIADSQSASIYFKKEDGSWRITSTPPTDKKKADRTKR